MSESTTRSRLLALWLGQHSRPHFPGDLLYDAERAARRVRYLYYMLLLAGVAVLVGVVIWSNDFVLGLGALFLGPVAIAVLVSLGIRLTVGRPIPSAVDVLNWWLHDIFVDWEALDGGRPPTSDNDREIREGYERLAGRSDDRAIRLRLGLLVAEKRYAEAREALNSWTPTSPVEQSNLARRQAGLRFTADGVDDLSAAEAAVEAVPDESDRRVQRVLLTIERARRESIRGGNPMPILASARPWLTDEAVRAARARLLELGGRSRRRVGRR